MICSLHMRGAKAMQILPLPGTAGCIPANKHLVRQPSAGWLAACIRPGRFNQTIVKRADRVVLPRCGWKKCSQSSTGMALRVCEKLAGGWVLAGPQYTTNCSWKECTRTNLYGYKHCSPEITSNGWNIQGGCWKKSSEIRCLQVEWPRRFCTVAPTVSGYDSVGLFLLDCSIPTTRDHEG
ncbi:uncharacterized protein LOC117611107 [Osmia lignaria lignaria]|uniref:uncharacterized protein LOC117611107 n=1 Tax=Osmia lignaria lignaria TaxID=1437193 RepID=UPI00402B49BB